MSPEVFHDYASLLTDPVPMIDVRAPVEFAKGALPGAVNLPILNDVERAKVGHCYKHKGPEAAVELGHRLVSGDTKDQRVQAWVDFCSEHPEALMYCFRGGQRSGIAQQWLREANVTIPKLEGGYKAARSYFIDQFQRQLSDSLLLILGGRTGTGKTEILLKAPAFWDLEGCANHRGSGFGRMVTPQPSQVDFEHALYAQAARGYALGQRNIVVEDESRCIGRCSVPVDLWKRMKSAHIVIVESDLSERTERIKQDYVIEQAQTFAAEYGEDEGWDRFVSHLTASLDRIKRRLGGARHKQLREQMETALAHQRNSGDATGHEVWIHKLLVEYYDPMYDYQIRQKLDKIRFTGSAAQVQHWLRQNWPA